MKITNFHFYQYNFEFSMNCSYYISLLETVNLLITINKFLHVTFLDPPIISSSKLAIIPLINFTVFSKFGYQLFNLPSYNWHRHHELD